ncbi:hypothetical protein CIN_17550 [Commensalibacter intestini A911]|uniref:Uncharacterized protein n=1 Tax=Commensalibacter intestini A911 TaxID=1088868 RepID=G6F2A9_9PROT|nr:hypothetical protein CIN_17550 [Commensalibacter intestini A911]
MSFKTVALTTALSKERETSNTPRIAQINTVDKAPVEVPVAL